MAETQKSASIIPRLLESQDRFISLLKTVEADPFDIFNVLIASKMPANLFLKHLVVLADFGGEPLQRLSDSFKSLFPFDENRKRYFFTFVWKEKTHVYFFEALPIRGKVGNLRLGIDGVGLSSAVELTPLHRDVIAILMFAASAADEKLVESESLTKCEIGALLGQGEAIDHYVDQKYLWVSRITGGAEANMLGQYAQSYVVDYLKEQLGSSYSVVRNGKIDIGGHYLPFDVVVDSGKKKFGIEVSFQVTTNSTIERKGAQAESRQKVMHKKGHSLIYIIDGAGNFQRRSAITKICDHSDCTVAYSKEEFDIMVNFIKENSHA